MYHLDILKNYCLNKNVGEVVSDLVFILIWLVVNVLSKTLLYKYM
jgi:hypothetical protein